MDGGGIRGLSELLVLEEIMNRIKVDLNLAEDPLPADFFDLIGGTSTGGLNALLLGRLRKSVRQARTEYVRIASEVFSSPRKVKKHKFDAGKLEEAIKKLLGTGRSEETMLERDGSCKVFVCAVPQRDVRARAGPRLFRTYSVRENASFNCKIWEACRATSAAPTFFEPIKIGDNGEQETFMDGGLGYNNPVEQVLEEAARIFPGRKVACVISIGTGVASIIKFPKSPKTSLLELIDALKNMATESDTTAERMQGRFRNVQDTYFRFSVDRGLEDIGLEEWKELPQVCTATTEYLRQHIISTQVDKVVSVLLASKTVNQEGSNRRIRISKASSDAGSSQGRPLAVEWQSNEESILSSRYTTEQLASHISGNFPTQHRAALFWSNRWLLAACLGILAAWVVAQYFLAENTMESQHLQAFREKVNKHLEPLDFSNKHLNVSNERLEGTGEWVFDTPEFRGWEKGSWQVLWLVGIMGSGKTTIMSNIIDRIKHSKARPTSYIYYRYGENHEQTQDKILSTILDDFINIIPPSLSLRTEMETLIDQKTPLSKRIRLDLLRGILNNTQSTCLVIDALDEAPDEDGLLLAFLTDLVLLSPKLKLVLSSRPHIKVADNIDGVIQLPIKAKHDDIEKYVDQKLLDVTGSRLARTVSSCPELGLGDLIREIMLNRTNGMFLLAKLNLRALQSHRTCSRIRQAVEQLPRSLDEAHHQALARINEHQELAQDGRNIIKWLTFSPRQMTLKEIQTAIAVNLDDLSFDAHDVLSLEQLEESCQGLIVIGGDDQIVEFGHFATKEFFANNHKLISNDPHWEIAACCLAYMTTLDYGDVKTLRKNAFYRYAAAYWGEHARGTPEEQLWPYMNKLFEHQDALFQASLYTRDPLGIDLHYEIAFYIGLQLGPCFILSFEESLARRLSLWLTAYFGLSSTFQRIFSKLDDLENALRRPTPQILDGSLDGDSEDANCLTVLEVAALKGHWEVMRQAISRLAAEANASPIAYGTTTILLAALGGHVHIVSHLLMSGSPIEMLLLGFQHISESKKADISRLLLEFSSQMHLNWGPEYHQQLTLFLGFADENCEALDMLMVNTHQHLESLDARFGELLENPLVAPDLAVIATDWLGQDGLVLSLAIANDDPDDVIEACGLNVTLESKRTIRERSLRRYKQAFPSAACNRTIFEEIYSGDPETFEALQRI